jgi:transcriptional regulator with XRE-family HTH domain
MRLGYRSNPIANWEAGRRYPTADEALAVATRVGCDVPGAVTAFHPPASAAFGSGDVAGVAAWLDALRGQLTRADVARRAELSAHAVRRWMNGATRPRLPDFLRLVDAMTGRVADLVASLVDIERVPALADAHRRSRASRRLAFELPWTEAVLRVLECAPGIEVAGAARRLGVSVDAIAPCLDRLREVGLASCRAGGWRARGELSVDTRDVPEAMRELKAHWASLGVARAREVRPDDLVSYNVFSVSREDLARIRQLHIDYFLAVRAVVAESEPEVAAMINVQLLGFSEAPLPDPTGG